MPIYLTKFGLFEGVFQGVCAEQGICVYIVHFSKLPFACTMYEVQRTILKYAAPTGRREF